MRAPSRSHSARRGSCGSLTTMSSTPCGLQRRDRQEADRPAAGDEPARPWSGASATRDAVQRDGHRLRERGVLRCEVVRDAQQLARGDRLVARRTRLAIRPRQFRPDRVRCTAKAGARGSTRSVPQRGDRSADDPVADLPIVDLVARPPRSVPLYSWPSIAPSCPPHSRRKCRSEPQIPQWLTSMSTSCGPSRGVGRSSTATVPQAHEHGRRHRFGDVAASPKGRPNLTRASRLRPTACETRERGERSELPESRRRGPDRPAEQRSRRLP